MAFNKDNEITDNDDKFFDNLEDNLEEDYVNDDDNYVGSFDKSSWIDDTDDDNTIYEDDDAYHGKLKWSAKRLEDVCKTESDFVKYVAIFYLSHQLFHSISIIRNASRCKGSLIDYIPKNTCNWNLEDCLTFRNLDMFKTTLKNLGETCVRLHKLNLYIDYIREILQFLMHAYLHKQSLKDILKLLEDTWERIRPKLLPMKKTEMHKALNRSKAANDFIGLAKHLIKRRLSENVDPWALITYKFKYTMQYEEACFDQAAIQYKNIEEDLSKQINNFKEMYLTEEYCGEQILHFYFEEIDRLSRRYGSLKSIYEEQETTIVHENEYIKRQITKLQNRQIFYEDELERYNYEIHCIKNNIKFKRKTPPQAPRAMSSIRPSDFQGIIQTFSIQ